MNYEGPYLAEGFLHNLYPYFDIAFAQLGVMPRRMNKSVEIVAVAECYLITNHVKGKNQRSSRKIVLNLQHCQFGQDGWKTFLMKIN